MMGEGDDDPMSLIMVTAAEFAAESRQLSQKFYSLNCFTSERVRKRILLRASEREKNTQICQERERELLSKATIK
jgi:hypothetical protein